jgi:hypothetical protein
MYERTPLAARPQKGAADRQGTQNRAREGRVDKPTSPAGLVLPQRGYRIYSCCTPRRKLACDGRSRRD